MIAVCLRIKFTHYLLTIKLHTRNIRIILNSDDNINGFSTKRRSQNV